MTSDMLSICQKWHKRNEAFILVSIAEVLGSTPRDPGAILAVSKTSVAGTIGGGRLEWDATTEARTMLEQNIHTKTTNTTLGPDIGQCCGGRVTLLYRLGTQALLNDLVAAEQASLTAYPAVFIYGAGHVGRALAAALESLPLSTTLIDSREEELALFNSPVVKKQWSDTPVSIAEGTLPDAAHVVLTHSHALDSLIAAALLERGNFRYLGIIGSRTKRNTFRKAFQAMGIPQERIDRVVCPIGGQKVSDKRPEIIAALTAAEIIQAMIGK